MSPVFSEVELTAEQAEEAERIADIMMAAARVEIQRMARLLASKSNGELLGETEFQMRAAVHRVGARGVDAALSERKKRGTEQRASSASSAAKTPSSSGIARRRSRR